MRGLAAAALLVLGACAQDYGGITEVVYTTDDQTGRPEVRYISGKEAENIEFTYDRSGEDVSVSVVAGGIEAFEGQAIQADRIKEQFNLLGSAIEGMFTALCASGQVAFCRD